MFSDKEINTLFNSNQITSNFKLVNVLSKLLKLKFKLNNITSIAHLTHIIMERFIINDNNIIIITLKKLFLIYLRHHRLSKLDALYKWITKTKKIKNIELKLNEIETSRKQQQNKIKLNRNNSAQNIPNSRNYHKHFNIFNHNNDINENISITKPETFEILVTTLNKTHNHNHNHNHNINNNNKQHNLISSSSSTSSFYIPIYYDNKHSNLHLHSERNTSQQMNKTKLSSNYKREKRLTDLYQQSSADKEKKLEKLRQEQEEQFSSKCPFKPTLHSYRSKSQSNLDTNNISTSFMERLQQYEINKRNNLSNLKRNIEQNMPKPQTKRRNSFEVPIQKNYFQIKKQKVDNIQKNIDDEQGITFRPKLNDNKNKNVKDNITKRNMKFLINKENKLLNRTYISNNNINKECTFEPYIRNRKFKTKMNNNKTYQKSFDERLQEYKHIYETHKDQLRLKYENCYSFMPKISENTDKILHNKRVIHDIIKKRFDGYYKVYNDNNNNIVNKEEHNDMLCSPSQEIQEISDEETNSIANYDSKELNHNDNKKNFNSKNISLNSNKLKLTSESLTDDKAFQMAKLKLSVDDSLEKFQLRYGEIMKKKENIIKDKVGFNYYPQEHVNKNIINNRMEYYDNLE